MAIAPTIIKPGDDREVRWQRVRKRSGIRSGTYYFDPSVGNGGEKFKKSNILNRMSMSLFITNFPDNINAHDLRQRCLDLGVVTDVFISNRLSKQGKHFGFVRFKKVDNAEKLLVDLRSIWFGKHRLYADVEKYGRKVATKANTSSGEAFISAGTKNQQSTNKSYAEVLSFGSGNSSPGEASKRIVKILNQASNSIDKDPRSLLVKIIDPVSVPVVRQWLFTEGFIDCEVYYVGGRWLLITFSSIEVKDSFLTNDTFKNRFLAFKVPCDSFVPDERMVWVEVSGLPKGAWHSENFQVILSSWGKGVFFDTEWDNAFSMGKVCILSHSHKFIFEELKVDFNDKVYEIWLREFAVWEPRILGNGCASSTSVGVQPHDDSYESSNSSCSEDNGSIKTGSEESKSTNRLLNEVDIRGKDNELNIEEGEIIGDSKFEKDGCASDNIEVHVGDYVAKDNDFSSLIECLNENVVVDTNNLAEDNKDEGDKLVHSFASVNLEDILVEKGDCGNDATEDNVDVMEERSAHYINGLDDHDVFLLNRLLQQDKCQVRPVKAVVNKNLKVSSKASLNPSTPPEFKGFK